MEGCQDELLVDVVGPDDDMTQPRRGHLGSRPGSLEDTIDKIERSRARILRLLNQENAEEDFQESGPGAHLTDARNRWRITGCLRRAWVEEEVSEDSARLLNEHGRQGIETRASEEQEKRQENACAGESSIFQCPPPRTQEDHRVEGFFFGPDPPSLSKITTCQLALAPRRTREECVASILSKYIYIEQEKTPKAYLRGYIALISGVVARFAYSGFNRRTTNSTVLTPIRSYVVMTLSVHSGEEAKKTERKKPAAAGGSGWKRHNYVGNTLSVQNIPVEEAKVEKVTPAPPPTPNEAWKFRKYLSCISVWSSRDRVVDWLNNLPEFVPSGSRLLDALAPRLKPRTGSGERVETPLSSDSQPEEERLMRELDDCPQPDDDTEWSDVDR